MKTEKKGGHRGLKIGIGLACIVLIVAAAVVLVVVFAGGKKEQAFSPQQFEQRTKVTDQASKMFWDARANASEQDAANKTIDWLKQQSNVKDAALGSGCIGVVFKDGSRELIMTTTQ